MIYHDLPNSTTIKHDMAQHDTVHPNTLDIYSKTQQRQYTICRTPPPCLLQRKSKSNSKPPNLTFPLPHPPHPTFPTQYPPTIQNRAENYKKKVQRRSWTKQYSFPKAPTTEDKTTESPPLVRACVCEKRTTRLSSEGSRAVD